MKACYPLFYLAVILLSMGVRANDGYSIFLIGGGLKFCSSQDIAYCQKPLALKSKYLVDFSYLVTDENLNGIDAAPWLPHRADIKRQVLSALQQVSNTTKGELSRRQFTNAFRKTELMEANKKRSGAELLRELQVKEHQMLMDWLQQPAMDTGFLRLDRRKSVKVQVANSKSLFSVRVVKAFIQQASGLTNKEKPKIVVITAGRTDAFAEVDFYRQIFEQMGAEFVWLPVDAALMYAQLENIGSKDNPYCRHLEVYRQQELGRFQRHTIYPDLAEYQLQFCQKPKRLLTELAEAQGLFIADGDPALIRRALIYNEGQDSQLLKGIRARAGSGKLVVAADGGGARALTTGGDGTGVMLIAGRSHQALSHGSFAGKQDLQGCEKQASCPPNYVTHGGVYEPGGGLGLFHLGIVDTQFSELARQGRLIRLLADTPVRFGFGIDERTALLVQTGDLAEGQRMEVLGENGVSIYDSLEVQKSSSFRREIRSIRYHLITQGDKALFNSNKLVISFADWKFSSNKMTRPVIQSGNAFRKDNFRRIVNMLCSTGAQNATLKHSVVGMGHVIYVQKSRTSISLFGRLNINGENYGYCSFRDFYLDVKAI